MSDIIRIVLADDHNMVRTSLATFLDSYPDLDLIGQATNGREAVDLCLQLEPDVVLMDLFMPEMNGVEAIRAILKANSSIKVLALTSFKEDNLVYDALQAGAVGYLLKDDTTDELTAAIRDVHAGKTVISPEAMQALLMTKSAESVPEFKLTPRETEILSFMVQGLTNRQIALELDLSPSTVKFHVSSVLSKLNAASRTEAVAIAIQHKLIL